MTYELFLNEASEARRRFGPAGGGRGEEGGIPSAEARIAALEKALGEGGGGAAGVVNAGKAGEVSNGLPKDKKKMSCSVVLVVWLVGGRICLPRM